VRVREIWLLVVFASVKFLIRSAEGLDCVFLVGGYLAFQVAMQGNRIKRISLFFGDKALLTHSVTVVALLGRSWLD